MDMNDRPALQLAGLELDRGWSVVEMMEQPPDSTGGFFSVGYRVRNRDGAEAFLKALDLSRAFQRPNWLELVNEMTAEFLHEQRLCYQCKDRRMTRVVVALDHGEVEVASSAPVPKVPYMIFELGTADCRHHLALLPATDYAWRMKVLHHAAVGLQQLHAASIVHQDLKPSNIVMFDASESKLADLGRASAAGQGVPHDLLGVAGDRSYAPPELLYGDIPADWVNRRNGCDIYLLGSLMLFFFAGTGMTAAVLARMDPDMHWSHGKWTFREVLPYMVEAWEETVAELDCAVRKTAPRLVDQIVLTVRELTNPDPALRGHPVARRSPGGAYGVNRYVSRFDLMYRACVIGKI